jgi:hypothetical protein
MRILALKPSRKHCGTGKTIYQALYFPAAKSRSRPPFRLKALYPAPTRIRKHCGTGETLQHGDRIFRAAIEIGTPSLLKASFCFSLGQLHETNFSLPGYTPEATDIYAIFGRRGDLPSALHHSADFPKTKAPDLNPGLLRLTWRVLDRDHFEMGNI